MTSSLSFGCYKNYHVEHYFPANFCRLIKRRLSTVVSLVSRLFNNNNNNNNNDNNNNNLYFKRVTPITMNSILPRAPLKTKLIIINYKNHDKKPIYK